jgi:hypothetical protein
VVVITTSCTCVLTYLHSPLETLKYVNVCGQAMLSVTPSRGIRMSI